MKIKKEKGSVKGEIRILGIDDSPFEKGKEKECLVVATVFRGGSFIDGLLSCKVEIDGNNATKKLISLINKSRHKQQLRVIMLDGIALGGFNVVDINMLYRKTRIPVIVVMSSFPNLKDIRKALAKLKDGDKKWKLIVSAGKIFDVLVKHKNKNKKIYFQVAGVSPEKARDIVKLSTIRSFQPEPLRVAHLIASGIVKGESRGRA